MRVGNNSQPAPLAGRKIVIDPGHGGKFTGAVGPAGTREKDVNLAISLQLAEDLIESGAQVRLTRSEDTVVAPGDPSLVDDLKARVTIANSWPADLFISIHSNSNSPNISGTEAYHARKASESSKRLCRILHQHMVEDLGLKDNGVRQADFHVIKNTSMPGMLMETAYISNPAEEALLADPKFQKDAAHAMARGITEYFTTQEAPGSPPQQEEGWGCWLVA